MVTATLQVYKYFSTLNFFLRFFRNLRADEFYFGKTPWNCQCDRTISLGLHDRNTENTGLARKSNSSRLHTQPAREMMIMDHWIENIWHWTNETALISMLIVTMRWNGWNARQSKIVRFLYLIVIYNKLMLVVHCISWAVCLQHQSTSPIWPPRLILSC